MPARPISHVLVPIVLSASGLLVAANLYLRPDLLAPLAAVLVTVGVMAVVWRRSHRRPAYRDITTAIVLASLMLDVKLAINLIDGFGTRAGHDFAERVTMALMGVFFIFMGNAMPKTLRPLAALRRDPARVQAARRFEGWTWVVSGLAFAVVWLAAPMDLTLPLSMAAIVGAIVLIIVRSRNDCVPSGPDGLRP
jgi:hypothetical protein